MVIYNEQGKNLTPWFLAIGAIAAAGLFVYWWEHDVKGSSGLTPTGSATNPSINVLVGELSQIQTELGAISNPVPGTQNQTALATSSQNIMQPSNLYSTYSEMAGGANATQTQTANDNNIWTSTVDTNGNPLPTQTVSQSGANNFPVMQPGGGSGGIAYGSPIIAGGSQTINNYPSNNGVVNLPTQPFMPPSYGMYDTSNQGFVNPTMYSQPIQSVPEQNIGTSPTNLPPYYAPPGGASIL